MKVIYEENVLEKIHTEKKKAEIFDLKIEKIILNRLEFESLKHQGLMVCDSFWELENISILGIRIEVKD